MRTVIMTCLLAAGPAAAQDWALQDDAGIAATLTNRTVVYDEWTVQTFDASGATQYITERAADGRWAARGGQYCSTWPPSDNWDCYDFYTAGDQVRFVASDRSESVGQIAQ